MKPKLHIRSIAILPARLILTLGLTAALHPHTLAAATWSGAGADSNWGTAANWDTAIANSFNTALVFAGTTQTNNINNLTGGTAPSLTFSSGAGSFVIGGTAITLAGSLNNNSSSLQTLNLPIALSSTNTITTDADVSLTGVISGSGSLSKAGNAVLTLSGANTYTGATTIAAGTLKNGSASTFSTARGTFTPVAGTFDLNGFNAGFAAEAGGGGTITNNGTTDATLTCATSGTSATTVFTGLIKDGPTNKTGLIFANANTSNLLLSNNSNTFSGGIKLINGTGSGTRLYLPPTTTFSSVGSPGAITSGLLGTGPITIGSVATDKAGVLIATTTAATIPNAFIFNTALGTDYVGIRFGSDGHVLSGAITANSNAAFSGSNSASITGAISGAGGLVKGNRAEDATGTITLSGTNTYAGATTVSYGTLLFSKLASMPATTAVTVTANGTLGASVGSTGQFTSGTGNGTVQGLVAGLGAQSGSTIVWSATPNLAIDTTSAGGSFSLSAPLANPSAGALNLYKIGTGTLSLAAANTFTGTTNLTAGTLSLANSGALGSGTAAIVFRGGTLQFTASNTTDYSGRINSGTSASAVTIDTNSQNVTFATALNTTKTGGLTKTGAGTLTLTGNNTYTGTTSANAGTLVLTGSNNNGTGSATSVAGTLQLQANAGNTTAGVSSALGTVDGKLTMVNGGTLQLRSDSDVTFAGGNTMAGLGSAGVTFDVNQATAAGTGRTLTFSPVSSNIGGGIVISVTGGNGYTLALGSLVVANNLGTINTINPTSASVTIAGVTLGLNPFGLGGTSTGNSITGVIQGTGALVKSGASTWTLNGTNTYGGGTTIAGGTLVLGNASALGTAGTITFTGGTLQYGAGVNTDFSTRIESGSSTGAVSLDTNGNDVVFSTALSGTKTGGLTKLGLGKLTLAPGNLYTGTTTVSNGTLVIPSSGSLGDIAVSGTAALGSRLVPTDAGAATSLTFAGGTFQADFINSANPGQALISTGTLALNGNVAVSLANTGGLASGVFPLISYTSKTGTGVFTQASTSIGPRSSAVVSDDPANSRIIVTVAADKPRWTGLASGEWSTATIAGSKNWKLNTSGTATDYLSGDSVLFDDTATGTRTINITGADVTPSSVLISTAASNYKIGSTGGFGITGSASLLKNGSGTVVVTTTNSYTGSTTIDDGVFQLGDGTTDGALTATSSITLNGILAFNNLTDKTLAAPVSGIGSITKSGPGGLTVSGSNSYEGDTVLNAGTLTMGSSVAIGRTVSLFTINGGAVDSSVPNLVLANNNPQLWNVDWTFLGTNSLNLGSGAVDLGTNIHLNVAANTLTIGGAIRDGGMGYSLTKTGAGTLLLNGLNVYAGETTIAAGTLTLGRQFGLSSTSKINFTGGTLQYGTGITDDVSAMIAAGSSSAPVAIDTAGKTVKFITALGSGQTAGLNVSSSTGTGLLTLSAANTYAGNTQINGNTTLQIGASGVIPDGSVMVFNGSGNGAKFELQNFTETVGGLSGTFGIIQTKESGASGTGTIIVDTAGQSYTYDGIIRNRFATVAFVKNGAGTQTLTNTTGTSNDFSGGITINGGILKLRDAAGNLVIGTLASNVSVASGATLSLENSVTGGTSTTARIISGAGNLSVGSGNVGTITLTGVSTYTGNTSVRAGTLVVSANSATTFADSSTITIASGAVLNLPNAATDTVAGLVINGVSLPSGTYDATSAATTGYITGSGKLKVVSTAAGYAAWAATEGLTAGVNDGLTQDPDGDGISNLLEYVLGGHPVGAGASDTSILPSVAKTPTALVITFHRSDASETDTTQVIQTSTDMVTWTNFATVGATSSGPVVVTEDSPTPALDTITVSIPLTNAVNGKLFTRLKVSKP